ncbi:Uncharacterised protein [uncultured archaeon]|nr:Uncharacterised protein [uncultured archaeon]
MANKPMPQIQWGTFYDNVGRSHVAPCIEGYLMSGHALRLECACWPDRDQTENYDIVVHYVIQ